MASIINVDQINEATSGSGVQIPGHTIQTVSNFITTDFNTASTSFVTTGLAQAITPSSTSSKILCIVSMGSWYIAAGGTAACTIYRGSTNIGSSDNGILTREQAAAERSPAFGQVLDSPATTSATTYTVYGRTTGATTYISYPSYGHFTLTLMEIAQ